MPEDGAFGDQPYDVVEMRRYLLGRIAYWREIRGVEEANARKAKEMMDALQAERTMVGRG